MKTAAATNAHIAAAAHISLEKGVRKTSQGTSWSGRRTWKIHNREYKFA